MRPTKGRTFPHVSVARQTSCRFTSQSPEPSSVPVMDAARFRREAPSMIYRSQTSELSNATKKSPPDMMLSVEGEEEMIPRAGMTPGRRRGHAVDGVFVKVASQSTCSVAICQFLVRESLKAREGDSGVQSDRYFPFQGLSAKKASGYKVLKLMQSENAF